MESMSRRHAKVSPNSIQAGGENILAHRFTANVNSRPTKVLVTECSAGINFSSTIRLFCNGVKPNIYIFLKTSHMSKVGNKASRQTKQINNMILLLISLARL